MSTNAFPSYALGRFRFRRGRPLPFGASPTRDGINFALASRHASSCSLLLFKKGERLPMVEIPFLESFRSGDVYAMTVLDLDPRELEYGFRLDGPYDPARGQRFDAQQILLDPYARAISGLERWRQADGRYDLYPYRALPYFENFDWGEDQQLNRPLEECIVYEMHARGFTAGAADVECPGSYAAIAEKIPYLLELGVNAIELMPIFEFDELDNKYHQPETGERLLNYWGYSPIGFFAPKAAYAAGADAARELKQLVKSCHQAGIEVWLDVVLNHTAESDEAGPTLSFRGIDNSLYYLLKPDGSYHNFSGTGNSLNCNHPAVRALLLDCLRYWVSEYHIDGFRFDLASSMTRDTQGNPDPDPPLLEALARDPILAHTKLIAEAWDAGGLYQVGSFPDYGRWAEWNGRYRDDLRRFVKGDGGMVGALAARLGGSPDLYAGRGPWASVNFITAHDGFSLWDLVAYNQKHNEANGQDNADGMDENLSWNCGWEGATEDAEINALRRRQMKNFLTLLLFSQGLPMLLMGDEICHSKGGNNNSYCHDGALNSFDWARLATGAALLPFLRHLILWRKALAVLRRRAYLRHQAEAGSAYRAESISYHGTAPWQPDWSHESRRLALLFCGAALADDDCPAEMLYVIANAHWEAATFVLPRLPARRRWHLAVNTSMLPPRDSYPPGEDIPLGAQESVIAGARSVIVLLGR